MYCYYCNNGSVKKHSSFYLLIKNNESHPSHQRYSMTVYRIHHFLSQFNQSIVCRWINGNWVMVMHMTIYRPRSIIKNDFPTQPISLWVTLDWVLKKLIKEKLTSVPSRLMLTRLALRLSIDNCWLPHTLLFVLLRPGVEAKLASIVGALSTSYSDNMAEKLTPEFSSSSYVPCAVMLPYSNILCVNIFSNNWHNEYFLIC